MTQETPLHRLRAELSPDDGTQARVRARMMKRIESPAVFEQVRQELTPGEIDRMQVWSRILDRIDSPQAAGVFDRLRSVFTPTDDQHQRVRTRLLNSLAPVHAHYSPSYRRTKMVAAFALVLIALRASPVLFLAPRTVAESAVIVVPTRGEVNFSLHELWQPVTAEATLNEAVQLKTGEGEATVILHDDGTVRLAPETLLALHDLSDRPEPALDGPTMSLTSGRVWMQGLLPRHLRGITLSTPHGDITVHAGSVSVAVDETSVTVRVWDRHAVVTHLNQSITLVAGERVRFGAGEEMNVTLISDDEFQDPWVTQNLQRDAVHQREIAQMQQERRAARAGILPNSPLYPVKRVAERMEVLLTLDPQAKVQKQLEQASTRLDEAAALIAEGSSGATVPLQEYKDSMLAIANGSGGTSVTQFLVRQEVAENTADLSAALPNDDIYLLKKTVLEASAELPVEVVDQADVEGMLIVDTLDVLQAAIDDGDTERAEETLASLQPYLQKLEEEEDSLNPDLRKEVLTLLSDAAQRLGEQTGTGIIAEMLTEDIKPYLPPVPEVPRPVPLTDAEIDMLIAGIEERIFVFSQPRSRWNQLQHELRQLKGHHDEGRILRKLYHALPENGLARYVRTAIQELREDIEL